MLYFMSTVRKLYKPVRWPRLNPILKCKHSFENQEVGRHLETGSQITTRVVVSKAISIFCKLSHLGGNELCSFMIFLKTTVTEYTVDLDLLLSVLMYSV